MADKSKRRMPRHDAYGCTSAQVRAAEQRERVWAEQARQRDKAEIIDNLGRGFLRVLLWAFLITAAVAGSAARLGIQAPTWMVGQ